MNEFTDAGRGDMGRASQKFEKLIACFEEKLRGNANIETKEIVGNNFGEIIEALVELKQNLLARVSMIDDPEKYQYLEDAAKELGELLGVFLEISKNGLDGFGTINKIEAGQLLNTTLTKEDVAIILNFVPTERAEARVNIKKGDLSFRVDYVPENKEKNIKGGVYFDLDTPGMNKLLDKIQDEHGNWHHFRSDALQRFANREDFAELVKYFKETLLEATDKHFDLSDLIKKFNQKQTN